jgi:hypothetical protein
MPWVRLDDGFVDHPKIARVGPIGAWLQIQALCYCNRNLTDGFVPFGVAQSFLARGVVREDDRGALWTLGEHSGHQGLDLADVDWPGAMVAAGIWEAVRGGYQIHDYGDYQPSKAEVLAERKRHAKNQQAYRDRSTRDPVTDRVSDRAPVPVPVPGSQEDLLSLASLARPRDDNFDEFWTLYPRHEGKAAARRAWKKLGPVPPLELIRAALAWQRSSPRWLEDGGRFMPHPATYLNGRRWEDEPPRQQSSGISARTAGNLAAIARGLEIVRP